MSLSKYRTKRKFESTPEPKGKKAKIKGELSFVVQRHQASHLHYDFRLAMNGVLKSWAVPKGPPKDPPVKRLAVMVEDHPLEYGKFHGVIPKGNYGAGTVEIWDKGTYRVIGGSISKGDLKFMLFGEKLRGEFALVKFGKEEKNWLFIKKAVKSEGTASPMPHKVKPMLATLADKIFDDEQWVYETKWDGYRAIAETEKGAVKLYSRNSQNFNESYPEIVESLKKINHDLVLDGEIVALDKDGVSRFQLLQEHKKSKETRIVYFVFDLLYIDGRDIRDLPLLERKNLLHEILPEDDFVKYSNHIEKYGSELFSLAKKREMEGIMAKKKTSQYASVRSSEWQKIKNIQMQEAVVGGFTKPRGGREALGALVLGVYDNGGQLKYIGHTGGGFDDKKLKELKSILEPLKVSKTPFEEEPATNAPVTWVRPKIVVQVKFNEWTRDKIMRQPIFIGIREDKKPDEVVMEANVSKPEVVEKASEIPAVRSEFSNLEKAYWPKEGYTKGDLIEYYNQISEYILPYLKDRPQSLNRHPNGIGEPGFFQKDMRDVPSWVKTVKIHSESEDKDIHWLICNDKKTLLYMANLGCIEINPWNSRYQKTNYPDYLILDLDPNGARFSEVRKTAMHIKKILDKIQADSFVKTSGKTGLHILVPLGAKYTFEQTRQFAEILARRVSLELPKTTSVVRDPKKREKKIYVDFLQNRIGQTISAPYCVRPVPKACVSTPLKWDELKTDFIPQDFTIKNIFERLEKNGDVWKDFSSHKGIDMLKSLDLLNS